MPPVVSPRLPRVVGMGKKKRLEELLQAMGVGRPSGEMLRRGDDPESEEWGEPADGEEIAVGDPRVRLLPDPAEVFTADQAWLGDVLMPVLAVDLSAVDPAWSGWLPVVDPVEPVRDVQGCLGEKTEAFHDAYAGEAWIALRLEEDGRLRFLGQREYFLHELLRGRGELRGSQVEAHYVRDALSRADFIRRWRSGERDEEDLFILGGELYEGNWTTVDPPDGYRFVQPDDDGEGLPSVTLADGRPFRLVGETHRWSWSDEGVATLLVLFEPESRTVLLTFEYD